MKSGPYEVAGGAKLFDRQGKEYSEDQIDPIYLCRCRQPKNKPFCDGSYKDAGFKAEETASWASLTDKTGNVDLRHAAWIASISDSMPAETSMPSLDFSTPCWNDVIEGVLLGLSEALRFSKR